MKKLLFLILIISAQLMAGQLVTINIEHGVQAPSEIGCDNTSYKVILKNANNRFSDFEWTTNLVRATLNNVVKNENTIQFKPGITTAGQSAFIQISITMIDSQTGSRVNGPTQNLVITPSNNENFHITMGDMSELAPSQIKLCRGESILLGTNKNSAATYWNNQPSETISVQESERYIVEVKGGLNGCSVFDTVRVHVIDPEVSISLSDPNKTKFCTGDSVILTATSNLSNAKYEWSNGSYDSTLVIKQSGAFEVTADLQRGGCPASNSVNINVLTPSVGISILEDVTEICEGNNLTLIANSNFTPKNISWNFGAHFEQNYTVEDEGEYIVNIHNGEFCKGTSRVKINVNPNPVISEIFLQEIEELPFSLDGSTFLTANDLSLFNFEWTTKNDSTLSNNPELLLDSNFLSNGRTENITLTVNYSASGCSSNRNFDVIYNQQEEVFIVVYVPNVFKPDESNSDNNSLKVYGESLSEENFNFEVYDRWGQIVYATTSVEEAQTIGWMGYKDNSGDLLQGGTYTYKVSGQYTNGSPFDKIGTATMIR